MNGVLFGDKHSYKDWGLILSSRPEISPPEPKTLYIEIPASDGSIDLTEAMTGETKFKNRKINFEFTVIDARNRWTNIYSEILDYLHGQNMKIVLDEDQEYYYFGRLHVDDWQSDKATSSIKIEAEVEPYKLEKLSSMDEWIWDTFNFETGEIRYYKNIRVDDSWNMIIHGSRKSVVPTFHVTLDEDCDHINLFFKPAGKSIGESYQLVNGENRFLDLVIKQGDNEITFGGNGTVSIDYHGGRL